MRKLALLLIVAACGDDGVRHTPDAAPHDGPVSPDGPADTAGTPVALTVSQNGTPVAGIHVYFQNADSTLVLATTTDATGTASAVMAAGGYVTAIDPSPQLPLGGARHFIETFAGVKPGDQLQLADGPLPPTSMNVTIQAPVDPVALNYLVFSPCNTSGTSIQPPPQSLVAVAASGPMTLDSCGATTDFLVVTYDDTQQPRDYFYVPNVAVADGQTIDLTTSTYVPATTRTLTFQNVPRLQSVSVEDDLIDPHGKIFAYLNETPSDTIDPVLTESTPGFTGAASLVQTTFTGTLEEQTELDWGPYTGAFTTDVGAHALVSYSGPPQYDVQSHAAAIPESATGLTPDFMIALISATRETDATLWQWFIAAPHGTLVTLPVLPTDIYDFNISATDAVSVDGWASGKVPGGYDAVRAVVLSLQGIEGFATSASGTATLAHWQAGGPVERTHPLHTFQSTMVHHASTRAPRVRARRVR